ncbi:SacI homology domain-containing protein [Dimargaris cristalligena]|uniref:SacI homology domain-containing protein n=1 Tax=Dimargaris cristalligena TaxID=215637 RepID=A0A4Q0A296_9FUNG|nr:SacI homology domain-containing protein [Dimargaris cristalligena]|eukprot:RKP39452.1 SacI homology domain-containing protein [Dimargaris cristalligena]
MPIFGILGTIRFLSGDYLVVITAREKVGEFKGHQIYHIKETKSIAFNASMAHLDVNQKTDEVIYLATFKNAMANQFMYYSYTYDMTNSMQRQQNADLSLPLWKRADDRFHWNSYLQSHLGQALPTDVADRYQLPVIQGFLEVRECAIKTHRFTYVLLSRRSRFRVGTRYFSRGADEFGNVSNFVETEQMVFFSAKSGESAADVTKNGYWQFSHVQTRGSIPIFWAQVPNMKYVPVLKLPTNVDTLSAFKKHFEAQTATYGDQIVVNLVNKKKYEEPMGLAFNRYTQLLDDPRIHYLHFDFHQECSKMRWHRISILMDKIKDLLDAQSYYSAKVVEGSKPGSGTTTCAHRQTSVVRTNCMDCLDRTNVVQSVVARFVLTKLFRELNVLEPHENIDDFVPLETMLRNVWADHADAISIMYSGTGALKTDFTRTGQRTKDGVNSLVRYVKNNYLDGARQDGIDLMLGNYVVRPSGPSPFQMRWTLEAKVLFGCAAIALAMLFVGTVVPRADGYFSLAQTYYVVTWSAVLAACFYLGMKEHAYEFINWPKLVAYPYRPTSFRRRVVRKGGDKAKKQQ